MRPDERNPDSSEGRQRRSEEILEAALALPPSERDVYLGDVCDGPAQRREVERLLAAEEAATELAVPSGRSPSASSSRNGVGGSSASEVVYRREDGPRQVGVPGGSRRDTVGRYRILSKLGEGGMGTVFLAEQPPPIERRVALKVIRSRVVDRQLRQRFTSEHRALARMNHPNIAQVYEAGETPGGSPYIAMEHVEGVPITRYCNDRRLAIAPRLELMAAVCDGIQHAHQKAVLHRDLKPRNVLVAEEDGRPVPKVIDFGIAKGLDGALADETLTVGQVIGTPAYISPESILHGDGSAGLDARSDVYGLGILLYELLVGVLPHGKKGDSALKILQHIERDDAVSPSMRLAALSPAKRASRAAQRGASSSTLARELNGELDWIVLKATAREPAQRYPSADALGKDLRRYLEHQPVLAGPASTWYRLRKLIRRHRAGAVTVAVAVLAVLAGLAGRTLEASRANREAARANQEAARANREAETAEQVSKFLIGLFEVNEPGQAGGDEISAREILDRGVEKIRDQLAEQPRMRARMMATMSGVYNAIGLYDQAAPLMDEALALRRAPDGATPLELAETLSQLSNLRVKQGRFDEAETALREALELRRAEPEPDRLEIAINLTRLAIVLHNQGRLEASTELQLESLEAFGDQVETHDDALTGLNNLGTLYLDRHLLAEAEPILKRVLERREASARQTTSEAGDSRVAQTLNNLGLLYIEQDRATAAIEVLERSVAISKRVLGAEHPDRFWGLRMLGQARRLAGDHAGAEAAFDLALRLQEDGLGPDHPYVSLTLEALGQLYQETGRLEEAERTLVRCLANAEASLDADHPSMSYYLSSLGRLYREIGRLAEAAPLLERSLAIRDQAFPPDHPDTLATRREFVALLRDLGRTEEEGVQAALLPD